MFGAGDKRALAPTRRAVLGAAAAACLAPSIGRAQEAGRKYRLAVFSVAHGTPPHLAMYEQFKHAGFIEGGNLIVDRYGPALDAPALAAEFAKAMPDVIVAGGDALARTATEATKTIPIVANSDDLLASGLLVSFAHPESNLTGVSMFATELNGKRQELLIEMLPGIKRLATLADPATTGPDRLDALVKAAATRGIEASVYPAATGGEIGPAIEKARAAGAQAVNVLASALFHGNHRELIDRTVAANLPAMFQWPEYVEEGALVGYGPRLDYIYGHLIARQVIKLFRGAKPSEVPAEQPTDFELGINLQTAAKIQLTVPQSLLTLADEVIR